MGKDGQGAAVVITYSNESGVSHPKERRSAQLEYSNVPNKDFEIVQKLQLVQNTVRGANPFLSDGIIVILIQFVCL